MNIKSYKHLIFLSGGIVITTLAYVWFYNSPYFEGVTVWARSNIVAFSLLLVTIKIVGIIWPPLPGGIFTFGSIPILGWPLAYVLDFIGSLIGSTVAYGIAYKWGIHFLRKIFDEETIKKMQTVKVVPERELEAIFVFRLLGSNIVEIVCYAAGLLKVRYGNYLLATVLSHAAIGIPSYYFAGALFGGRNILINLAFAIVIISLFTFFKKRYFTKHEFPQI